METQNPRNENKIIFLPSGKIESKSMLADESAALSTPCGVVRDWDYPSFLHFLASPPSTLHYPQPMTPPLQPSAVHLETTTQDQPPNLVNSR